MTDTYLYRGYLNTGRRGPSVKPSYLRVLSNVQFTILWVAQLVSQSGDYVLNVAIVWLVLQTTGSAIDVGLALAASLLPNVLVGPVAGVLLDSFNCKDLMLISNLAQASTVLAVAMLYYLGVLGLERLLAAILLLNAEAQFFKPAIVAIIPRVVDREDLMASNGLISITTSLNQITGYGVGGVIVALFGVSLPIFYDCLTFLVAFALITFLKRSYGAVNPRGLTPHSDFVTSILQGFSFIKSNMVMAQLVAVGVFIHFAEASAYALLAPYVKITLLASATTYGLLLAMIYAGTMTGSALISKLDFGKHLGRSLLLGICGMGMGLTLLGNVRGVGIVLLAGFIVGIFTGFVSLPIQVLVQSIVPGKILGRVTTALIAMFSASQPIGSLLGGIMATSLSPGPSLVMMGIFIMLSIVAMAFLFRDLRTSDL